MTSDPDDAPQYHRLRRWNLMVGLVHAAQAGVVLALSNDLSLPISGSFLRADPVTVQGPTLAKPVFDLPIGAVVAAFLLLAALDHLLVAAPGVREWYERNLARRVNYARWIEYSISASVMIVLIAMFVGIRDLAALIGIFGVNTAMILFGLLMERHQAPGDADWTAFWFGTVAGTAPWLAIIIYIAEPPEVPGFVWAITAVQLVLFATFAINMALQYRQVGRWRDYLFGERTYLVLSLAAKSLLAWLIFANVLRS
ncbi:MAG: hypothetical protein FJW86_01235 [Actinobacteria bacterium]|nr:hypothetical protein [Actinomycetota bacterium]